MSKLTSFFKQNKKSVETFDLKLESFDEPITLRIISGKENENLQREATKTVRHGRKAQKEFDNITYARELAITSIVNPDLNNTELQESYGVVGASELYNAMFNWAEQTLITQEITEKSGLDQDPQAKADEVKNS